MRASWLRRAFAAGVFAVSLASTGCRTLYHVVRASPPATWRGATVVTVQPVDWSGARIDGRPHAAFAAMLEEERRPLLYNDMETAGAALRTALLDARGAPPPLRATGDGPQLRLEVVSWERGYWAWLAGQPTILVVRGTLERTAGSSEDVAEFVQVVHHEIVQPHPAAGLQNAAEQIVGRILAWLEDSVTR